MGKLTVASPFMIGGGLIQVSIGTGGGEAGVSATGSGGSGASEGSGSNSGSLVFWVTNLLKT